MSEPRDRADAGERPDPADGIAPVPRDEAADRADPLDGRIVGLHELPDERRPGTGERRPMQRIGDLIPAAARHLGLEEELRFARAVATWAAIVGERVPGAAGETRLIRVDGPALVVEVDSPMVGQELRLRSTELLAAFRSTPGGGHASDLRIRVRPG